MSTVIDFEDGYVLRHAQPDDHDALRMVCLKTGNSGKDATATEDDPTLLGTIYAVPYQVLSPDFSFVVEGPNGVCGYILGALDTPDFYRRLETEWFPPLRDGMRDPGPDEAEWQGSDWARRAILHPEYIYPPVLQPYRAHGHIDLLEEARGRRIGSRGMRHMMDRLAQSGANGIHLQVSPVNFGAHRFYKKLGFTILKDDELPRHTTFMARTLP